MKFRNTMKALVAFMLVISLSGGALANDWSFVGRVNRIEPNYVPNVVAFIADVGAGSCPAGSWLIGMPQVRMSFQKRPTVRPFFRY